MLNKTKLARIEYIILTLMIIAITGVIFNFIKTNVKPKEDILGDTNWTVNYQGDYSSQKNVGYPGVFGGVHSPDLGDEKMWSIYHDIGITNIRSDLYLEFVAPREITVEDYKSNKDNLQDPSHWTARSLDIVYNTFHNAKKQNMRTTAIAAYIPPWLSTNGTDRGLPKDWQVFDDIVSKTYERNRENINSIEIWNEPDHPKFMQVGSDNREQAYSLLYRHISNAVRQVDEKYSDGKKVLIGGPAIAKSNQLSYISEILTNPTTKGNVDFISFHLYGEDENIAIARVRQLTAALGYPNIPIYVSEWNKSGTADIGSEFNTTYLAVPYTANQLISFLNMGVNMASYFSLSANIPNHELKDKRAYGFYQKSDRENVLLPQAKVWQLLSTNLRLGKAESKIFTSSSSVKTKTLAFQNDSEQQGFVFVNENLDQTANITLSGLSVKNKAKIQVSKITKSGGLEANYCEEIHDYNGSSLSFKVNAPEESVTSILVEDYQPSLLERLKTLSISTKKDCLVFNDENTTKEK